jgi:hypothetical protein
MKDYYCECCNYKTFNKSNFNKHILTRKHLEWVTKQSEGYKNHTNATQKGTKTTQSTKLTIFDYDNNKEKSTKLEIIDIGSVCQYCKKAFSSRKSRLRHESNYCKYNDRISYEKLANLLNEKNTELKCSEEQMDECKGRIQKLEKQIGRLMNRLQINNINFGNQINSNHTTNIQVLNYNKTDYDFLTEKDILKCFSENNHCVKALIEKVHFNKNKPENMNIYISSIKGKFVMVYRDNKWQIRDRKRQIDDLYECNELMLENWYDEYQDKFPHIIKSFKRYLKNRDDDDDFINKIKDEVLLMLYNKRDMVDTMNMNENYVLE